MKTIVIFLFLGFTLLLSTASFAQKTISEGTISYEISLQSRSKENKADNPFVGATSTRYLKGGLSKTGNAAILKEYSGQKLMILLTKENWDERNKKFEGIVFEPTIESKVIGG